MIIWIRKQPSIPEFSLNNTSKDIPKLLRSFKFTLSNKKCSTHSTTKIKLKINNLIKLETI